MRPLISFASLLLLVACPKPEAESTIAVESSERAGLVQMELEAQKHVGLQVAPAAFTQLAEYLQVTGTVQPVDSRVSSVRPLARGRLHDVLVRVGDRVQSGQALARFDNIEAGGLASQLAAARGELHRLKIQLGVQTRQTERQRRLADIGATPRKDYEQTLAEQQGREENVRSQESVVAGIAAQLKRLGGAEVSFGAPFITAIRSPFAGVVTKVNAAPGEVADSEDEIFTVADLSRVWVQAEVYEKDLGRIRIGQIAFITVDTYPDRRFGGKVTYMSDVLDPQTRTAKVRCEVVNRGTPLKIDMFATVQLPTTFRRQAVAVPADAVQQIEDKAVVFVQSEATKFETREVGVGKVVEGLREITSGLRPGEPVVVQGAFHLKSIVVGRELGEEE
ncbi:MAG: efflux RND transporter periplasmic adaptor subunit [Bryobacteraceae bacterium]